MSNELIEYGVSQADVIGNQIAEPMNMPSSPENPSFDLDDPDAWDLLAGGGPTSSGVRVSEEKALMHPAVWQALNMIPGDIAALPLELFREMPDGDRVKQDAHPIHEIVLWQPNTEMNAFKFWSRMMAWRLLWNNAYAFIRRTGSGRVLELLPLLPDRTAPERIEGRLYCVTEVGAELQVIPMENVIHLEGLSIDNLVGYSFIKAAREVIGLALSEFGFASKFYRNGGRVGGILELPSAMGKPARDKVEQGFRQSYNTSDAFKTVVLRENAKFHQAQVTPEAAQVVEGRQESVRDIARFFNVRPGKLGEESRSSFASKSEDNRDYYDTTLEPHTRGITQECRSKLLSRREKREGYYFAHDIRSLLRMDFKSMADALSSLRSSELINADEGRSLLNMNKRSDGRGGDYINPNINTTDRETSESSDESTSETAEPGPTALAFRSLLSSTVKRMAGFVAKRAVKLAANPKEFLAWIDDGYEGQRESIAGAVGEVIRAAGEALPIDADALINETVGDFMAESLQILRTVADSTTSDELKAVVSANLNQWADEAGTRYASRAFPSQE